VRVVPVIDLKGFRHQLVERRIRLRNGILDESDAPAMDGRPCVASKPAPMPAMVQEAIRADQQRLQGVWNAISGAVSGRPSDAQAKVRWTITGDKIVLEMSDRWVGKCTLDPARSPKRINLAATSSDGATEEIRGIYEVRGDRLCVCLAFGDEPRPESLRSSRGARQVSLALERGRP
jgi:uncharacterized protein (TIGR03067 family)